MLHVSKFGSSVISQFEKFMDASNINPILMDIGSAGASPAVWKPIASGSTLVGFEPDDRNPDATFGSEFREAILINRAIIPDDEGDTATFILTEYPSCSSMLEADLESLSSFVFRDFFKPVKSISAPATSLNRVIKDCDLAGINWLKIDSQGADLRILRSMLPENIDTMLAVDIEPGLIDAYLDEDLFPECHQWLKNQGFWMAEFFCQAYVKMRPDTLSSLESLGFDKNKLTSKLVKAPTCVEGRYLREVAWLEKNAKEPDKKHQWMMSILFGFSSQQIGYVFDLLFAFEKIFGVDEAHKQAKDMAERLLKEALKQ